jgi:peptidoglycan/xylan/chitin deacetylase (PgdA/CDA1 family)
VKHYFLLAAVLPLAAAGCRNTGSAAHALPATIPIPVATVETPKKPEVHLGLNEDELQRIRPNELGRIPVVMYHAIGASTENGVRYDRMGLNIRPETFRKQLRLMYDAGWYPINMRDALSPDIDVPAGKTPVVLTFDDARGTQFDYKEDGTIDPDCALAILEGFHDEHPDWPLKGSFYVLPKSRNNPAPFYQEGLDGKKLKYLVDRGFEVANHSTTHRMMARLSAHELAWEMAQCVRYVKERVPGATMDTMALPGGSVPRDKANLEVLLSGCDGETKYTNKCILRAWGGATLPPAHRMYDRRNVLRIGVEPGYLEAWIKILGRGEVNRFVSDGDPLVVTVPKRLAKWVSPDRTRELHVAEYDDRRKHKTVVAKAKSAGNSGEVSDDTDAKIN